MDVDELMAARRPSAPAAQTTAVRMTAACLISPDGTAATVRRSAAGPVHVVHHRVTPGPDVVLFTRDSAGLVGGDECTTEVTVTKGATIVISDPGPTNLYPSGDGRSGHQTLDLSVGPGACALYLPHATVPFSGSCTEATTQVHVAPSGAVVIGSVLSPGRVANGETWHAERYEQRTEILVGDDLVACDAVRVGSAAVPRRLGLDGIGALVSLIAYRRGVAARLDLVRLEAGAGAGVSAVTDDLLVLRAIVGATPEGYSLLRKATSALFPNLASWEWGRIGYASASSW